LSDVLLSRGDLLGTYQTSYGLFTADYHGLLLESPDKSLIHGVNSELAREIKSSISGMSEIEAISALELSLFLGQRLLRDTDSASMSVSLEARVPLLDHVVVEEAFKLSPDKRYDPIGKKKLLRELAMPNVDPAHFDREKSGFVLPIEVWSRSSLRTIIEETFRDQELIRSVGLNQTAILRLYYAFQAGAPGIYWSRIWSIFVLLYWCRRYKIGL
jgi:asparagine synthase (glutamine-hydrolysing)